MAWRRPRRSACVASAALLGILVCGAAGAAGARRPPDRVTQRAIAQARGDGLDGPGYVVRVGTGPVDICAAPSLAGTTIIGTRVASLEGRTANLAGGVTAGDAEVAFEFSARRSDDSHRMRLRANRYGAQNPFLDDERPALAGQTSFWAIRIGGDACVVFAVTPVADAAQARAAIDDRTDLPLDPGAPGVAPPELTHRIEPLFSAESRRHLGSGGSFKVRLLADVDASGAVRFVHLLRRATHYAVNEDAMHAILQWRYRPATRDGVAVAVQFRVDVTFSVS